MAKGTIEVTVHMADAKRVRARITALERERDAAVMETHQARREAERLREAFDLLAQDFEFETGVEVVRPWTRLDWQAALSDEGDANED